MVSISGPPGGGPAFLDLNAIFKLFFTFSQRRTLAEPAGQSEPFTHIITTLKTRGQHQ